MNKYYMNKGSAKGLDKRLQKNRSVKMLSFILTLRQPLMLYPCKHLLAQT